MWLMIQIVLAIAPVVIFTMIIWAIPFVLVACLIWPRPVLALWGSFLQFAIRFRESWDCLTKDFVLSSTEDQWEKIGQPTLNAKSME